MEKLRSGSMGSIDSALENGLENDLNDTTSASLPMLAGDKGFALLPPKSPVMSSSSMMSITPLSLREADEFVIYSDSDIGSQNSLNLRPVPTNNLSASETESVAKPKKKRASSAHSTPCGRSLKLPSPRRDSIDQTPTPKPKKRIRRKLRNSDGGSDVFSHKSAAYPAGTGYTSTPATGKIFRNLLILEESLREQVVQQRALRRKYLTFLAILCSLIASISHTLYFSDSSHSGTVRVILQFSLLALLVTLMLYHLSGEYQKTIVLPRKFLSSTNKGLRQLNVRLVKIKQPLTDHVIDLIREFLLFMVTLCLTNLHKVYPSITGNRHSKLEVFLVSCQLQFQPRIGVLDVKLILNARVFNTDVREGWELYRSEFWIHESVRRRNSLMAFTVQPDTLERSKLLKKDKRERRDRRKSSTAALAALTETNLSNLSSPSVDNLSPYQSGMENLTPRQSSLGLEAPIETEGEK